jgi:hypothetical protein
VIDLERKDRFRNEHNFVFRKSDGLFYHAKVATPAWSDFAADSSGLTQIPLNMAEPILITRGLDAANALPAAQRRPGAYKNAAAVRAQIAEFGLAEIVDTIEPIGCIMAGDGQRDAP